MTIGRKVKEGSLATEDKDVQVPPSPNPAVHTLPSKSPSYSGQKREHRRYPLFLRQAFFFFLISSYLCLVVVCVRRGISVLFLSVSSVSKRSFLQSVSSALPHDLVSAGFLVMKSPMFTIVIHKKKTFMKNHLLLFLICKSM